MEELPGSDLLSRAPFMVPIFLPSWTSA